MSSVLESEPRLFGATLGAPVHAFNRSVAAAHAAAAAAGIELHTEPEAAAADAPSVTAVSSSGGDFGDFGAETRQLSELRQKSSTVDDITATFFPDAVPKRKPAVPDTYDVAFDHNGVLTASQRRQCWTQSASFVRAVTAALRDVSLWDTRIAITREEAASWAVIMAQAASVFLTPRIDALTSSESKLRCDIEQERDTFAVWASAAEPQWRWLCRLTTQRRELWEEAERTMTRHSDEGLGEGYALQLQCLETKPRKLKKNDGPQTIVSHMSTAGAAAPLPAPMSAQQSPMSYNYAGNGGKGQTAALGSSNVARDGTEPGLALQGRGLRDLRFLQHQNTHVLVYLDLSRNELKDLTGITQLSCLQRLDLSDNVLTDSRHVVQTLRRSCPVLREFIFAPNPCCPRGMPHDMVGRYRTFIAGSLSIPGGNVLAVLDRVRVTPQELQAGLQYSGAAGAAPQQPAGVYHKPHHYNPNSFK